MAFAVEVGSFPSSVEIEFGGSGTGPLPASRRETLIKLILDLLSLSLSLFAFLPFRLFHRLLLWRVILKNEKKKLNWREKKKKEKRYLFGVYSQYALNLVLCTTYWRGTIPGTDGIIIWDDQNLTDVCRIFRRETFVIKGTSNLFSYWITVLLSEGTFLRFYFIFFFFFVSSFISSFFGGREWKRDWK